MVTKRSFPPSLLLGFVLLGVWPLWGCESTGPTEVGVRTIRVGFLSKRGVVKEVYAPGATYFMMPFVNDWHTFDTRLQNLEMVQSEKAGDQPYADDLSFKTRDGNDVSVDVTVAWRINPQKAPHLLEYIGTSLSEIKDRLIRPSCRSIVRDILNELSSEDFYVAATRRQKADRARDVLSSKLNPLGIVIEQVILREFRFNNQYQEIIRSRKLAEQQAEALKSEARAARERALRLLEQAQGTVRQRLAESRGKFAQTKYHADATFIRFEQEAKAMLAESHAQAQAIAERNKALAGSGGRTLVMLKLADALKGKKIFLIPTDSRSAIGLQTTNVNQLLQTLLKTPDTTASPTPTATP
ncbi:MAG: prohibitin family protein [Myxococcales bacterium]|nr:prohibitin family protein [Myxococcales bacterium]